MTREEVHKLINNMARPASHCIDSALVWEAEGVSRLTDTIFNYFESTVCKNCINFDRVLDVCLGSESPFHLSEVPTDFRCDYFERKIK
jgi:hypothetical protein